MRRRLAGAVGAEEAGDDARADVERQAVDGDGLAVALGQPAGLDHRASAGVVGGLVAPAPLAEEDERDDHDEQAGTRQVADPVDPAGHVRQADRAEPEAADELAERIEDDHHGDRGDDEQRRGELRRRPGGAALGGVVAHAAIIGAGRREHIGREDGLALSPQTEGGRTRPTS